MNANKHIPFSVTAVFRTRRQLEKGETNVAILGSEKVFGQWDTRNAVYARPAGENFWEVAVFLDHGAIVKWTWITLDRWGHLREREAMPTRTITVKGDSLKVTAFWNKPMEIQQMWGGGPRTCIPPAKKTPLYTRYDEEEDMLGIIKFQALSPSETYLKFNEDYIRHFYSKQPVNEVEVMREVNRRGLYASTQQGSQFGREVRSAQNEISRYNEIIAAIGSRQKTGDGDAPAHNCRFNNLGEGPHRNISNENVLMESAARARHFVRKPRC